MGNRAQTNVPFIGEAYTLNASQLSCQTCINIYPSLGQDNHLAKFPGAYFRTPGRTLVTTASSQPTQEGRAAGSFGGRLFFVIGNSFYEYDPIYDVLTERGTLNTTSGKVYLLFNGTQIQIIDGVSSKVFTLATNVFTTISDVDFDQPITGAFVDGYGIYPVPNSQWVEVSENGDFSNYIITRRKQFIVDGGNVVACVANSQDIWILGETRSEIWRNTGGNLTVLNSTPFDRLTGSTLDRGCAAVHSVVQAYNTLIWLSRNAQGSAEVIMINQFQPQVISTEALHQEFNTYDTIDDAQAFSYTYRGHTFYSITFPSSNKTWVYDLNTGLWHQWADWSNILGFVRNGISAYCYHTDNRPYVLCYNTNKIYSLDGESFTNDGETIVIERTFPTLTDGLKYTTLDQFQLDLEKGIGLTTGQGSDPQIMLQISRDGGKTWGNEMWRSMGKIGEYQKQIRWNCLGTSRNFTPRIRVSDPVGCSFFNAFAVIRNQDLD